MSGHAIPPSGADALLIRQAQAPDYRLVRPKDPVGQLRILLTVMDGKIVVDFGRVVQWAALESDQAEKLAGDLMTAVRTARTLHVA